MCYSKFCSKKGLRHFIMCVYIGVGVVKWGGKKTIYLLLVRSHARCNQLEKKSQVCCWLSLTFLPYFVVSLLNTFVENHTFFCWIFVEIKDTSLANRPKIFPIMCFFNSGIIIKPSIPKSIGNQKLLTCLPRNSNFVFTNLFKKRQIIAWHDRGSISPTFSAPKQWRVCTNNC